ncbi:MAG: hypothetical protein EA405_12930 [Rhodospirillales bacterium]|nr:MAG: hypothetical protein EA405_12930 [Rhodospirillales bacterium]
MTRPATTRNNVRKIMDTTTLNAVRRVRLKALHDKPREKREGDDARILSVPVVVALVCFFAGLLGGPAFVFVALVGLGGYGLTSVAAGLRALTLVAAVRVLNPTLVSFPEGTAVLTWGVVLLVSVRILVTFSGRDLRIVGPLWLYALVVALLSVAGSAHPDISLMKLLSFSLSASAALVGFQRLDEVAQARMLAWLCSLWLVVVALSLPTLLAPGVAFATNDRGFQGILNQPQALGIFLVPAAVWFSTQAFGSGRRIAAAPAVATVAVWAMMLGTLARTAFAASALSLAFGALLGRLQSRADLSLARRRLFTALAAAACLVVLLAATSTTVADKIQGFVFKGGVEAYDDVGDAFHASRGKGIEYQWQNFLQNPIMGTGFQVYPSDEFYEKVKRIWGIPVSAAVEKGFIFVAVFEETGVIGGLFFFGLLYGLYRAVKATGDLRRLSLFFACIFVNVGEGVFFAAGGLGLYFWILIGFAAAGASGRERQRGP